MKQEQVRVNIYIPFRQKIRCIRAEERDRAKGNVKGL